MSAFADLPEYDTAFKGVVARLWRSDAFIAGALSDAGTELEFGEVSARIEGSPDSELPLRNLRLALGHDTRWRQMFVKHPSFYLDPLVGPQGVAFQEIAVDGPKCDDLPVALTFRVERSQAPRIEAAFDLSEWAMPYPFARLHASLGGRLREYPAGQFVGGDDAITFRFNVFFRTDATAGQAIERAFNDVINIILEEHALLLRQVSARAHVQSFDFPAPLRTIAQQYLQYFGQFLADLGIDATTELRQQAGRVLFSVTPSDEREGLERIREALDLFLELPSNPGLVVELSRNSDMAGVQLHAQVLHLQSQLRLAEAAGLMLLGAAQAKDAALQAKEATIAMLTQQRSLFLPPAKEPPSETPGLEVAPGVKVTPYKGNGLEVDLPRILSKLRRRLWRKESDAEDPEG